MSKYTLRILYCLCVFVFCTVTDFSAEDKASGVYRRTGRFFRGAESILPEKSGAIWQFFGPKNCQIARKKSFCPTLGGCSPPPQPPGSYAFGGVTFCTAVHRRPRQGISHFCELCSPRSPISAGKLASARATHAVAICRVNGPALFCTLTYVVCCRLSSSSSVTLPACGPAGRRARGL